MRTCDECGNEFKPTQNHPRYRFCSPLCKSRFRVKKDKLLGKKYNIDKEKVRASHRRSYHDPNTGRKAKVIEANAKRRSLQYSSKYCFDEELSSFVFCEAHDLRKIRNDSTGLEWHVDHIIPIKGKDVCGLHVWNNFQVIPKIENLKKGNKLCRL